MKGKWKVVFAATAVGVATVYAIHWLGASAFTERTAETLLSSALSDKENTEILRPLPLTATNRVAQFEGVSASEEAVQSLISTLDKAIRLTDAEYRAFKSDVEEQNKKLEYRTGPSKYGRYIRLEIVNLYHAMWSSGSVERFKWNIYGSSGQQMSFEATAIPKAEVRQFCIRYKEGDVACEYLAARAVLVSVDGILSKDNMKRVEFTARIEPTPQELRFRTAWPSMPMHSGSDWKSFSGQYVALFQLYDNGWRLSNWNIGGALASIPY